MDSELDHQHPDNANDMLPMHHLLNGSSLPVQATEVPQPDISSDDESPSVEEIEDEDVPTDSTVSLYTPNSKGHFSNMEHCDGVLRRSKRKRTPTTRLVSYWPIPAQNPSKKARTSTTPQSDPSVSLQALSPQSDSIQSTAEVASDYCEILPTPEAPPVEYFNISDSPIHTDSRSSSSSVQYMEVVTISSGSGTVAGNESGRESDGDSAGERDSEMSSVSGSDEGSVEGSVFLSDGSDLTTPQFAPLSTVALRAQSQPLLLSALYLTQGSTTPATPTQHTLRTTAVVTPSTQLLSSSSTTPQSTLHCQLPGIPFHTPLPTSVHKQLHTPQHTLLHTSTTTTNDEPELQLPYVHSATKVHVYTPNVADFRRVRDFLDHALTPADITKISAICDTTPIAVCRNMTLPSLPSQYLCLDLSREPLSVRYFWKLLYKAQCSV